MPGVAARNRCCTGSVDVVDVVVTRSQSTSARASVTTLPLRRRSPTPPRTSSWGAASNRSARSSAHHAASDCPALNASTTSRQRSGAQCRSASMTTLVPMSGTGASSCPASYASTASVSPGRASASSSNREENQPISALWRHHSSGNGSSASMTARSCGRDTSVVRKRRAVSRRSSCSGDRFRITGRPRHRSVRCSGGRSRGSRRRGARPPGRPAPPPTR